MKRLLLTALLAISPMTLAKDFNSDFLVGSWQCKSTPLVKDNSFAFSSMSKVSYAKNGTYQNFEKANLVLNNQRTKITIKDTGNWKVKDNVLYLQRTKNLGVTIDNPKLRQDDDFISSFTEPKIDFSDFAIVDFSKDKFSFHSINGDGTIDKKQIDICNRIK